MRIEREEPMDAIARLHTEAARCFRRACEAPAPGDRQLLMALRQAWLALARTVEERAAQRPRLILPEASAAAPHLEGTRAHPRTRTRRPARRRQAA
jgi:hypothetical protein